MKQELLLHADDAHEHATALSAWHDGAYDDLLHAAGQLRNAIEKSDDDLFGEQRGQVAALAGYVQVSAYALHERLIPPHEHAPWEAAREVGHAATRVLAAMNHDYGVLPV